VRVSLRGHSRYKRAVPAEEPLASPSAARSAARETVPDGGARAVASPRRSWKLLVKVTVSVGLLAYIARRVDFAELGRFLARIDPAPFAAAFLLYIAGQALSALKWRRLAQAVGFEGSASRFLAHYFIGVFFNAFGFGTVGGDLVRALYLAGPTPRRALAANTVVADRVSGLLVLLAIALAALGVFHQYDLPASIYWTVVVLSSALVGGWRLLPRVLPLVLPPENRLRRLVEADLAPYWNDGRLLAEIGLMSLVFHLSQIGVLLLLTRALALPVPWSYCFIVGPLVNVMAAVPVSLNGLGVREGGYVFLLAHIGIARESAVAFALSWFAVVMLAGAVGGGVYLAHRAERRPQQS
jgi:glycosyltransferase 2 family protein